MARGPGGPGGFCLVLGSESGEGGTVMMGGGDDCSPETIISPHWAVSPLVQVAAGLGCNPGPSVILRSQFENNC